MKKRKAPILDAGCVGCWGRRGSGKSTWAMRWLKTKTRAIVFDPRGEYADAGFKLFHSQRELARYVLAHWGKFRVAYSPAPGAELAELSALSWWLIEVQDRAKDQGKRFERISLVVEEMNLCFPVQGEHRCTGFAELCSRGRHRDIEMLGISQRVFEVSKRFRGNCTETVVFAQGDDDDRKAAARSIDVPLVRVQELRPLDYLHASNGDVMPGRLNF